MSSRLSKISTFCSTALRWNRAAVYVFLGAAISLFIWVTHAQAAETVLLQFRDAKLTIPLEQLSDFATGQEPSPDLQEFLQQTGQDPANVRQWMTTEIASPRLSSLLSPEFLLLQINETIGEPLGREDLDPLRTAFRRSFEGDSTFSILEVLENYPASSVRLELHRLERMYADVNLLVTRISPVLGIAEKLLPELLCECNGPAEPAQSQTSSSAIAYRQTRTKLHALLTDAEAPVARPDLPTTLAQLPSDAPALANKRLIIQFGPIAPSISLPDLTRFAETGELSPGWRSMMRIARINPDDVRSALNQDVSVKLRFLDQTLNNLLGKFLLYQVGQIVHTRSNTANIQALRAAAVLSAADDNHLSLIEILQQYPTQQIYVNGVRLARLGGNLSKFQKRDVATGVALSAEDWLVQLQASAAEQVCQCDGSAPQTSTSVMTPPTISAEQISRFLPANWQPVAPHREDRGNIQVVWLRGTPYEMGYQHGQYLHDEIASMGNLTLEALRFVGRGLALGRLAERRSYPDIAEECRGLTDATQDIGMSVDACLVLAFGDVYQEIFSYVLPQVLFWDGCSQWVATGEATVDGRLYHGSTVDNSKKPIDYIVNNPVVFIRQPNDGLPHVYISYPGMLWPNWGLNVAGITLGLDTLHPINADELALEGGSNVQIMGKILKTATSFADARQIMETQPRVRANLIMITDGKSKEAGVFEFTGKSLGVRSLPETGVLYMTNHSLLPEVREKQELPLRESSLTRFKRFSQLMEPDGSHTYYGSIDPAVMAKIGRDRINPDTLQASPFEVFDDDASPGGNGSLRQGIYDPERLLLWVAGGPPPVPENPFVCFSLGEMLNFPNAARCESPSL